MKLKRVLFILGLMTVFGSGKSIAAAGGNDLPNVIAIKIPAADGQEPTEATWQNDYKVEYVTVRLQTLPFDERGMIRGDQLACMLQQQQNLTSSGIQSAETYDQVNTPMAVQTLFKSLGSASVDSPFQAVTADLNSFNRVNWYSYRPFNANFGFYGYGYHPYYGYFGLNRGYHPYYGVYYNGVTYPYAASGYGYWQGGSYYYPYYRSW